jgi:redox-sensitive bicupin YhaK (pirin superfamily)
MSNLRIIQKVFKARPTIEGAGVHLKRAIGNNQDVGLFDPFLLLDDFHSQKQEDYLPGFPWHPHRGMETITYLLEGEVDHGDSMDNRGVINAGDVQWMTAGSGIIHQEMPRGDQKGRLWGLQLWANLPASHKMMDPRYRGITSIQIPQVVTSNRATVKIICGEYQGVQGPVQDIVTDPEYLDITLPAGLRFRHRTKKGYTVIAYILEGAGYFDFKKENLLEKEYLVVYTDGDEISVSTEANSVRFVLVSGKPLREPIAWGGPIVMNTQEELRIAFEEYQNGTFIKHQKH